MDNQNSFSNSNDDEEEKKDEVYPLELDNFSVDNNQIERTEFNCMNLLNTYKHKELKYNLIDDKEINESKDTTIYYLPENEDKENFDKISLLTLIAYCLPSFGKMSCIVLLNVYSTIFYESIGASLIYMSFFVSLTRGIEILLKPIIAHLSDQSKISFGRRKPFLLAGCGFYALFLILLFSPPMMKTSSKTISIWFGIFYIFFFIAESITNVPYLALGPELSKNSKQRERLYFFFYIFQYIGVLFVAGSPILINRLIYKCDCSYCSTIWTSDVEKCIENCKIMCNLKSNAKSLSYLSLGIGVFFVFSIIFLCSSITEKNQSFNKNELEFIPSLYQLIHNKVFCSLIIPWFLDVTIMTIFSTMLPFFLSVIINPQQYCIKMNIPLENNECSVNYYIGLTITIFFICCIFSCGLWHYLVNKYGKKRCWQTYSLLCIIPFILFLLCDEGTTVILLIATIITAIPTGGAYLNDVLLSDSIEYDEFITGKRNEGIFTMCSIFIPKFVSLFAQALPLSILSLIGFIPTENGKIMIQPLVVKVFIRIVFSLLPIIFTLLSFYFKLKYPIKNDGIMFQIKEAIDIQKQMFESQNNLNYEFYIIEDPVYKNKIINLIVSDEDKINIQSLADHFSNLNDMIHIYNSNYDYINAKVLTIIITSGLICLLSFVTLLYSFDFLSNQGLSFIPITALFLISFCIICFLIYFLKLKKIKKCIKGEILMDKKFFKLLIYQKIVNNQEPKEKNIKHKNN